MKTWFEPLRFIKNVESRNNLKKQSVRLYPRISPFYKGIKEIWG